MFLADRTNRNIVLDVVKEVFCLFRLGKLPSLSASVQREYTPVIQEENPFDARLTVSADTLQIGLIDAGTGVLAATLVPMVSSAQTSFDSIVSRNNAAVPSTADTPTLPPMHDLVVRTMKPIDQADITTVESVVNITQLLQKLPDSERVRVVPPLPASHSHSHSHSHSLILVICRKPSERDYSSCVGCSTFCALPSVAYCASRTPTISRPCRYSKSGLQA